MAQTSQQRSIARARAVAELSLDPLVARADELAQSWAVALILARPLDGIGGVPLEELAREGPALCAQMLRALLSDVELDRLIGNAPSSGREQSAPARRLAAVAGAGDVVEAIAAVEALRGVLWEALLEDFPRSSSERTSARQLADLSNRLGYVCASALAVGVTIEGLAVASVSGEAVAASVAELAGAHRDGEPAVRAAVADAAAVIVDERDEHSRAAAGRTKSSHEAVRLSPAAVERPLSWDESPPVPPAAQGAEIEIRDERSEEGPAAWIGSIGGELERYAQEEAPFVVLLVEPVEIERLRRAETPDVLQDLTDRLEDALAGAWPGSLTRQRRGRYWLLGRASDRLGARDLAEHLRQALVSAVLHHGAPLELAIGMASCPEDGLEASALAAHADVDLYAARAAARSGAARARAAVDEPA